LDEIAPSDYLRVLPLVPSHEEAGHMAFVHGVLDRRMPGRVLADDPDAPQTALVLGASGFLFVLGRPDGAAVDRAIPGILEHEARIEAAALWATSREWEGVLDRVFEKRTTRKEFQRDPRRTPVVPRPLPAGHRLVPLNEAIAARLGASVDDWLLRAWGGAAEFVRHGFGVAVLHGDEVASFCAACAIGEGEAEVEVGTAPRQRRRGLATHAALAFFDDCRRRGLRPAWTCGASNLASDRLARRLGFRPIRHVAGYPLRPGMERRSGRWVLPTRQVRRRRTR
jgi:RimJ/RimL family protein N-acetyltransferase